MIPKLCFGVDVVTNSASILIQNLQHTILRKHGVLSQVLPNHVGIVVDLVVKYSTVLYTE